MSKSTTIYMTLVSETEGFLLPDHVFFWTMAGTALVVTGVLLSRLRQRQPPHPITTEPTLARQAAPIFTVGALVMVLMLLHWFSWGSFKRMDVEEDKLILHYYMPYRVVEVPKKKLETLNINDEGKTGVRVHVIAENGGEYWSGLARGDRVMKKLESSGLRELEKEVSP